MKISLISIIVFSTLLLTACSDSDGQGKKDHVWKEQTDTIDRAMQVEGMLQESADEQRKLIEDQTQ